MVGRGAIIGLTLAVSAIFGVFVAASAQDRPGFEPPRLEFAPLAPDRVPPGSMPAAPRELPQSLFEILKAAPPGSEASDPRFRARLGAPGAAPSTGPSAAPAGEIVIHRPAGMAVSIESLWDLAQQYQPDLQEASARVDEALGRRIQAGKYPNPRLTYVNEMLGSNTVPQGDFGVDIRQEILTAGKWRLDKRLAASGVDVASVSIQEKQFNVLTRIRRGYFDYLTYTQEAHVLEAAVKSLADRVKQAKLLAEKAKTISKTELLSLELLHQEVGLEKVRTLAALKAAWGQLAADVGVPELDFPASIVERAHETPDWCLEAIEERVRQNSSVRRALLEVETARWALLRARAEAIPNFTIGGGYKLTNSGPNMAGGLITFEAPLPVWDRNQGRIREAEAALVRTSAAVRSLEMRLLGETREAYARFVAARQYVKQITEKTLPQLKMRADLIKQAYEARAENVNFNDIFLAEQAFYKAQAEQFQARRALWRSIAELQGLMQIGIAEEYGPPRH